MSLGAGGPPDPALDFLSDSFDAERALSTPGLQPPIPDAPVLDYLAKCRMLLPPDLPESLAHVAGQKTGSEVCRSPLTHMIPYVVADTLTSWRTGQATRVKHEQFKTKALNAMQRIEASHSLSLAGKGKATIRCWMCKAKP